MLLIAVISLLIWVYLLLGNGFFWWIDDPRTYPEPNEWPAVTAIVPARNEATVIGESLTSLLAQDYPGEFAIVLVNDHSTDETHEIAMRVAASHDCSCRVMNAEPLPVGWTGKVWAMQCGVAKGCTPDFFWFTDADIAHKPLVLRELVASGVSSSYALSSRMVLLKTDTFAEQAMIPAFVHFFRMLYPFRKINANNSRICGAAGGSMLVNAKALTDSGGLAAMKGAIIDDCTLAKLMRTAGGRLQLELTQQSWSLRGYGSMSKLVEMVSRSAYEQLNNSPIVLVGTVLGMVLTFMVAPILTLFASGATKLTGICAWILMSAAYVPITRYYKRNPFWCAVLPIIAAIFLYATVLSALNHYRGKGISWRDRTVANRL